MRTVITVLLTIQIMSTMLMVFFGWLGTKMVIPEGAGNWWFYTSMVTFAIMIVLIIFVPNKYFKS